VQRQSRPQPAPSSTPKKAPTTHHTSPTKTPNTSTRPKPPHKPNKERNQPTLKNTPTQPQNRYKKIRKNTFSYEKIPHPNESTTPTTKRRPKNTSLKRGGGGHASEPEKPSTTRKEPENAPDTTPFIPKGVLMHTQRGTNACPKTLPKQGSHGKLNPNDPGPTPFTRANKKPEILITTHRHAKKQT